MNPESHNPTIGFSPQLEFSLPGSTFQIPQIPDKSLSETVPQSSLSDGSNFPDNLPKIATFPDKVNVGSLKERLSFLKEQTKLEVPANIVTSQNLEIAQNNIVTFVRPENLATIEGLPHHPKFSPAESEQISSVKLIENSSDFSLPLLPIVGLGNVAPITSNQPSRNIESPVTTSFVATSEDVQSFQPLIAKSIETDKQFAYTHTTPGNQQLVSKPLPSQIIAPQVVTNNPPASAPSKLEAIEDLKNNVVPFNLNILKKGRNGGISGARKLQAELGLLLT